MSCSRDDDSRLMCRVMQVCSECSTDQLLVAMPLSRPSFVATRRLNVFVQDAVRLRRLKWRGNQHAPVKLAMVSEKGMHTLNEAAPHQGCPTS